MFGIPLRRKTDKENETTCVYFDSKIEFTNGIKIESTLDEKKAQLYTILQDIV